MDKEELIRRYNTGPADNLTEEERENIRVMKEEYAAKLAAGLPEPTDPDFIARTSFPIGLDDNNNPFPVSSDKSVEVTEDDNP